MGILHADRIIEHFRRGLYNHKPASYIISVDGELIRYKGMVNTNMTQHNAEEAIANTSYEYLVRTIMWIHTYMGLCAREVIVYMDGARVANKTTARPECALDVRLIRTTFTRLCAEHGYRVHALDHGESELQMYLQRDRDVDLNILLTRDSDMLSICYNHTPKYLCTKTGTELQYADVERRGLVASTLDETDTIQETAEDDDDTTFGVCRRNTASVNIFSDDRISDINAAYTHVAEDGVKVLDSCLWIVCGSGSKPMQAIGFDACAHRVGYNDMVFRTFAAMCGTDFTDSMLTPSMFTGFFSAAGADEKRYINTLKDVSKIVASVLYMGLKGGGEIKRGLGTVNRYQQFNPYDITVTVSIYYEYISTGVMPNKRIPKFNTVLAVKHFVYAMRAGVNDRFVKRELIRWANTVPLYECLMNLDAHLGTYEPPTASRTKPAVSAPKAITVLPNDITAGIAATETFIHFLAEKNDVLESIKLNSPEPTKQPAQPSKKRALLIAFGDSSSSDEDEKPSPRLPPPAPAPASAPLTPPQLVFELDAY